MRVIFGVLSLLVVVAIVGVLAKKQIAPATPNGSGAAAAAAAGVTVPTGTPAQQVQQVRQAVEGAMQAPRTMPDDEK